MLDMLGHRFQLLVIKSREEREAYEPFYSIIVRHFVFIFFRLLVPVRFN